MSPGLVVCKYLELLNMFFRDKGAGCSSFQVLDSSKQWMSPLYLVCLAWQAAARSFSNVLCEPVRLEPMVYVTSLKAGLARMKHELGGWCALAPDVAHA